MTTLYLASRKTLLLAGIAISIATLAACGNKEGKVAATQVAATVGSEEISVHQINQVLSRSNTSGATPEQVKAISRDVLEKLIDQQLAIDQATEKKLNRSPQVVADIEAARRDILARAYLQSVAAEVSKPSAEDAHKYFVEHPQLFSERRIFNVQELQAPADPATSEQLRSMAVSGKSIEDVANWLKAKGIRFGGGNATHPAEQIPLESLPKVALLKDGQSIVLDSAQGVTFMRVLASQPAPVKEEAAIPRIQQFLANQATSEAIKTTIKGLRAKTKITYMGEFGSTKPVPKADPDKAKPAPDPGAGLVK
jgi:EpsD family peptidyl-prolyl cis-trans isomerase